MTCRVLVNAPQITGPHYPGTMLVICGLSSPTCRCRCPDSCEHEWSGKELIRERDGRISGSTTVCARCGMAAMDHDVQVSP